MARAFIVASTVLFMFPVCSEAQESLAGTESVTIESSVDGTVLAGSLHLPGGTESTPGVVLLGVAGPNDRHLSFGDLAPFRVIAEYLQSQGVAVLTLDDRGIGGSGGNWAEASYELYASDALDALQALEATDRIDPERTGFLGLSEGSAIAMMAAARAPERVDFLVLGSPPGLGGEEALRAQFEASLAMNGISGAAAEPWRAAFEDYLALARARDIEGLSAFLSGPGAQLVPPYAFVPRDPIAQARLFTSPWYQSQLEYDPSTFVGAVEAPALILGGTLDPVLPSDLHHPPLIAGIENVEVVRIEGVNHLLLPAETGSPAEYASIKVSADPRVLDAITDWFRAQGILRDQAVHTGHRSGGYGESTGTSRRSGSSPFQIVDAQFVRQRAHD